MHHCNKQFIQTYNELKVPLFINLVLKTEMVCNQTSFFGFWTTFLQLESFICRNMIQISLYLPLHCACKFWNTVSSKLQLNIGPGFQLII